MKNNIKYNSVLERCEKQINLVKLFVGAGFLKKHNTPGAVYRYQNELAFKLNTR
ncbi:hypothetical protein GCM10022323_16500 [Asaccharospora irregularis DSM 2635]